jgi:hypothetical protein
MARITVADSDSVAQKSAEARRQDSHRQDCPKVSGVPVSQPEWMEALQPSVTNQVFT